MGVQIEQLKTSDFFLFFTKKNETTFFQVLSHFLGVFFCYKNSHILGINDCTSNFFDIDLQDFFLIWLQHLLFPFFNFIVPMHVLIVSVSHVVPVFVPFFKIIMKAVLKSHHQFKPKNFQINKLITVQVMHGFQPL